MELRDQWDMWVHPSPKVSTPSLVLQVTISLLNISAHSLSSILKMPRLLPPSSCSVGIPIPGPHEPGPLKEPIQWLERGVSLRSGLPLSREPTLARAWLPRPAQPSRSRNATFLLPLGSPGPPFPQELEREEKPHPPPKECRFEPGQN